MLDEVPPLKPLMNLLDEDVDRSRKYCADMECVDAVRSLQRMIQRKQAAAVRIKILVRHHAQDLMLNIIEGKSAACPSTPSSEARHRSDEAEPQSNIGKFQLVPGDTTATLPEHYAAHQQPLECAALLISTDNKLEECNAVLDSLLEELLNAIWAPS